MNPLKTLGEVLTDKTFWLTAVSVVAGFKACDLINAGVGRIDSIPESVVPFVGPAVVILGASFAGKTFGPGLIIGAGLHLVDTLAAMAGVPQGSIRE